MKRKQKLAFLLFLIFTAGTLLFIQQSNDHKECLDHYKSSKDSNGNLVVNKEHVCEEQFSF